MLGALLILEIGAPISAALVRNYLDEIVGARELKKSGELTLGDMSSDVRGAQPNTATIIAPNTEDSALNSGHPLSHFH